MCKYCEVKDESQLDIFDSPEFNVAMDGKLMRVQYEESFYRDRVYIEIDYCPKCGRKLEAIAGGKKE